MKRSLVALVVLCVFSVLSCSGGSGGSANRSSTSNSGRSGANAAEPAAAPEPEAPLSQTIRDARIILRQAKSDTTFVLVNRANSKRQTHAGRLAITNGDEGLTYKALSEKEIDNLLISLEKVGIQTIKEPIAAGDESAFTMTSSQMQSLTGMVVIENNGERYKAVGVRPMGSADPAMQQKLKVFTDVKGVVAGWYNAPGLSERPADLAGQK